MIEFRLILTIEAPSQLVVDCLMHHIVKAAERLECTLGGGCFPVPAGDEEEEKDDECTQVDL